MTFRLLIAVFGTLAMLHVGAATAQPAPPDKPVAAGKAKPERTAKSLDCSKQADAKGLHGKERKKFRSQCKKS